MGEIIPISSEDNFANILIKNVSVKVFEKLSEGIWNRFEKIRDDIMFSNNQRENVGGNLSVK